MRRAPVFWILTAIGGTLCLVWTVSHVRPLWVESRSSTRTVRWALRNGEIRRELTDIVAPSALSAPPTEQTIEFQKKQFVINVPRTISKVAVPGFAYEVTEDVSERSGRAYIGHVWRIAVWPFSLLALAYPMIAFVRGPLHRTMRRFGIFRVVGWTIVAASFATSAVCLLISLVGDDLTPIAGFFATPGIAVATILCLIPRRQRDASATDANTPTPRSSVRQSSSSPACASSPRSGDSE